jgi:hypothetical protein
LVKFVIRTSMSAIPIAFPTHVAVNDL